MGVGEGAAGLRAASGWVTGGVPYMTTEPGYWGYEG